MPQLKVWEAIALSCNCDPQQRHNRAFLDDFRGVLRYDRSACAEHADFLSRCDIAASNIAAGLLETEDYGSDLYRAVNARRFVDWASRLGWSVPTDR